VLKDITELIQFQHVPWTEGRIEGVLDFAMLNLAPGNRSGIVPDEKFDVFVQAAQTLEASVLAIIAERDQAESDKASRDILRQVHKAFVNALRQLPSNEYLFFDIPEPATSLQKSTKNTNGEADGPTLGLRLPALADARDDSTDDDETPIFIPLDPGPLAAVRITPRHARRKPGERCQLVAKCYDEHHARSVEGIDYQWRVGEGEAELVPHGDQATAGCDHEGQATIEVLARQGELEARDQVVVKFLDRSEAGEDDATKGLPSYRLDPEHGKPWRSRYDAKHNEIVINSAHRDFLSSKTTGAKHRRYIGKLYAKEVVLINFPHESPSEVMERLIELTLRTEDVL
jgi:hypothetical protein